MEELNLLQIDLIVTHQCNIRCPYCVDSRVGTSDEEIDPLRVLLFLKRLRKRLNNPIDVLILGGEPTMLSENSLIILAEVIRKSGFNPIISTNGINRKKIKAIIPYFNWTQITIFDDSDLDYWKPYSEKINIKLSGDEKLTLDRLNWFEENSREFGRRSINMYFTPDFEELCKDPEIWKLLESLDWTKGDSYEYAFYKGIRFKKSIHGKANVADEPRIPRMHPNGNYNKTWNNELMDDYLNLFPEVYPGNNLMT